MGENRIYFKDNWGLFIGSFTNNLPHKHYAIQLSISLGSDIIIFNGSKKLYHHKSYLIKSNVSHRMTCKEEQLLLLFYPTSTTGHFLKEFSKDNISEFKHPIVEKLKQNSLNYINGITSFENAVTEISDSLKKFICECEEQNHFDDERIIKALKYLDENVERVIPLKEMAEKCYLSESRFLHLFKEKTGITYRKVQQWNKVSQSFSMIKKQSLTETAHQFGFADSAHYTKVFKDTFGFNPKRIQKI